MSSFMKLNILINSLCTDQLRRYLAQMGHAEEPQSLPESSERDFAVTQILQSCAFFEDDHLYIELRKICSFCDFARRPTKLASEQWETLALIFARLCIDSLTRRGTPVPHAPKLSLDEENTVLLNLLVN